MIRSRLDDDRIGAMDRLNAYARHSDRIVQAAVIYGFKELAIRDLWARGLVMHRKIMYRASCGACGGVGWWHKPTPHTDGETCRRCAGVGWRRLHFVESTVIGGTVWHTPAEAGFGRKLWLHIRKAPTGPGDWRPRLPGQWLDAHELCRDLLTVERWLVGANPLVSPSLLRYDVGIRPGSVAELEPAVIAWRAARPPAPATTVAGDDEIPF